MRIQAENLRTYNVVKKAEEKGKVTIYGLYYDLDTGELTKVF